MIVVIDGYNILKHVFHPIYITDHHKMQFIIQLGSYGRKKGHKIVLIFDGGPWDRPNQDLVNGIYVIYSGIQQTADQVIKDYLQRHKAYDILLVSTDRELSRYAQRLKMHAIDSIEFYVLLRQETEQPVGEQRRQPLVKTIDQEHEELDQLMAEGSKIIPGKNEDSLENKTRTRPSRKLSKKERVLSATIKKL